MKQVIKIGLILIVAAVLGFILKASLFAISDSDSAMLSAQDFEATIKSRADSVFKNSNTDFHSAKRDYDKLMSDIATEKFITLSDGSKTLSPDKEKACSDYCNNKFAPLFTKYANDYFENTTWDSGTLKSMQATATSMLASTGKGGDYAGELKTIENTANGFFQAENVIARASKCSSVAEIGQIQHEANKCSGLRLPASTQNRLNSAAATAKNTCHNNIVSRCKNAKSYNAAQDAIALVYQYVEKYGWTQELQEAIYYAETVSPYDTNDRYDKFGSSKKSNTNSNDDIYY